MRTLVCVVVGFAVGGWAIAGRSDAPRELPPLQPDAPATLYGVGPAKGASSPALTCAGAGCHGGGRVGEVGSEHTTWAPDLNPAGAHDPHAKAYRVLFNPDSVRIAKLLGRGPAHKDTLCLKCHAPEGVKDETLASEGVGCTACHGPSEKWLTTHYLPEWKALSNRDKWDQGFVPTKNLVARVSNCAVCHVGAADREVNHDLIAAGHPRLNFEYTRFHYQPSYRKHWVEVTPQPDFEVRAWVAGQAANVRAAVELLRARADRATKDDAGTPWPEFTGFSCYACHQSIGTDSPKNPAGVPGRAPGTPGWELWHVAAAGVAAKLAPDVFPGVKPPAFEELEKLKALMAKANPKPQVVAAQATAALAELDAYLTAVQVAEDRAAGSGARLSPDVPQKLVRDLAGNALAADRGGVRDSDWDFLAAHFLGCAAGYHAGGGAGGAPGWTAPIDGLKNELAFPRLRVGRYDSPAGFDRTRLGQVTNNFGRLLGGDR